jgi:hypothetical protein
VKDGTGVAFLPPMNTQPTPARREDPTETPADGYMDDDFARFRTERLKKMAAPPDPEDVRAEAASGMFFGTTTCERKSATARLRDDRTRRVLDAATANAATRKIKRRRRRTGRPGDVDPEQSPPHGVDARKVREAERRAS